MALWALLMSGGSLLVSLSALWQSSRARVLTLRTGVRADVAEARSALNDLTGKIQAGVQSRERVSAATGGGGALVAFREGAAADTAEIPRLLAQLIEAEQIRTLAGYSEVEAKAVTVRQVRARVQQLRDKYAAA